MSTHGLGRYLSPEPLLQDPDWVASELQSGYPVPAYAYARNNPVLNVDADGNWPWENHPGASRVAYYGYANSVIAGGTCNCYLRIDDKRLSAFNDTCYSVATTRSTHNGSHESQDDCPYSSGPEPIGCDNWCKREALDAFAATGGPTSVGWGHDTCDLPGPWARERIFLSTDP